jgi:hypothetical protein
LYLNELNICDPTIGNQVSAISSLITSIDQELIGFISQFERNFLKQFFLDHLNGNGDELIDYINIINTNKTSFIDNGAYSLGVLSIFEYSSCFWSDFQHLILGFVLFVQH